MKASVIVLVALAATALMRRRSAAVRHWILSGAIVCAAATPLLERVVPSWYVDLSRSVTTSAVEAPQPAIDGRPAAAVASAAAPKATSAARDADAPATEPPMAVGLTRLVVPIWITGAAIGVLLLVVGVGRLTWLAYRAQPVTSGPLADTAADIARRYGLTRTVTILTSDHPTLVITWGWLRPRVLVPGAASAWSADRIRIVLSHELAHVQRGDWLVQLTAELLRSIYWFNPLLWIVGKRLRQESEQACDDAVLRLGIEGSDYAGHLLELARDASRHYSRWFPRLPAPAIVRPSSFERRVTAMLNAGINRTPLTRQARLFAGVALLAVTIPLAGFGQTFTTVSGIVTDPEGRMIPNVAVALKSTQRDTRYEMKTNRLGQFDFVGIPDGEYVLEARFMGFRDLNEAVSVAGQPVQRNVSLEVGMLQETLMIYAEPKPASQPTRRSVGEQWRPAAEYDPCSASPVGGCLKPPTKIRDVKPQYPSHLNAAKVSGVVVLSAKIGTDGKIVSVQLTDPADKVDPAFVQETIAAVNQWAFTPTQLGGVPIAVEMQVTAKFVAQ